MQWFISVVKYVPFKHWIWRGIKMKTIELCWTENKNWDFGALKMHRAVERAESHEMKHSRALTFFNDCEVQIEPGRAWKAGKYSNSICSSQPTGVLVPLLEVALLCTTCLTGARKRKPLTVSFGHMESHSVPKNSNRAWDRRCARRLKV